MSTAVPEHVRATAREVRVLFDRHQELASQMNEATDRHETAERQLVSGLSPEALRSTYGQGGLDMLSGEKPPVLQAEFPVQALEKVAYELRSSYHQLQRLSEDTRINASAAGAAIERMIAGLIELGLSRQEAERTDVDDVIGGQLPRQTA